MRQNAIIDVNAENGKLSRKVPKGDSAAIKIQ
jgi:hypothetical protein